MNTSNVNQRPDPNEVIARVLGAYLVPGKTYPTSLPDDIAPWYCYTADGGHSLVVVIAGEWTSSPAGSPIEDYLVPAPVKTVLRAGYTFEQGYPLADLPYDSTLGLYDSTLGLSPPAGDDEY